MGSEKDHPVVAITGFGLFGKYESNPSWEAVSKLRQPDNVTLFKKRIDVLYDAVDKKIPEIWQDHKPSLVIHVGVSYMARGIVLESCAHSNGYRKPDANQCLCPRETCKISGGCVECLSTGIDVRSLCEHLNQLNQDGKLQLSAMISGNAGRYLCEYCYYTSLKLNQQRTLFVHVPDVNEKLGYTIENIRDGLQEILKYLTDQL